MRANPCEDAEPIWENDAGEGCFFETYGEQLDIVIAADPLCIWTILDSDDVVSGYHVANRAGYLISTKPRPPGLEVLVRGARDDA